MVHFYKNLEGLCLNQGLVKGVILCFRNLYFYFRHGDSTSTTSQLTSPASQKSKDLNKVPLLLQDLSLNKNRLTAPLYILFDLIPTDSSEAEFKPFKEFNCLRTELKIKRLSKTAEFFRLAIGK